MCCVSSWWKSACNGRRHRDCGKPEGWHIWPPTQGFWVGAGGAFENWTLTLIISWKVTTWHWAWQIWQCLLANQLDLVNLDEFCMNLVCYAFEEELLKVQRLGVAGWYYRLACQHRNSEAPGVGRCQRWQPRSRFGHCALSYCTVLRSNSNSPIISINFLVTSIYFNSLLHLFPLIQLHWVSTVCDAVCNRSSKPVAKRLGKKRERESQIRCQIPAGLWLCARCRRIWRSAWDVDLKISEECASLQGLSSKLNKIIRYYI